jgi:hypothetical protein
MAFLVAIIIAFHEVAIAHNTTYLKGGARRWPDHHSLFLCKLLSPMDGLNTICVPELRDEAARALLERGIGVKVLDKCSGDAGADAKDGVGGVGSANVDA